MPKPESGTGQVVVSLISSQTTFVTAGAEGSAASELALEEEMNRRAGVVTEVLTEIMAQPVAFRHWGLNE
jgi:hypothetical protein